MEPQKKPTKDQEINKALDHIYRNALGIPTIREDAAPTSTTIRANNFEFYNDKLYVKLNNGKLYSITLTEI